LLRNFISGRAVLESWGIEALMGFCNLFSELQCMKHFGVVEEFHQWSWLTQNFSGKPFFVLPFRKLWGALHTDRGQGEAWREREGE
jgi:hypothetical protein